MRNTIFGFERGSTCRSKAKAMPARDHDDASTYPKFSSIVRARALAPFLSFSRWLHHRHCQSSVQHLQSFQQTAEDDGYDYGASSASLKRFLHVQLSSHKVLAFGSHSDAEAVFFCTGHPMSL